jgi:hypothetical protein
MEWQKAGLPSVAHRSPEDNIGLSGEETGFASLFWSFADLRNSKTSLQNRIQIPRNERKHSRIPLAALQNQYSGLSTHADLQCHKTTVQNHLSGLINQKTRLCCHFADLRNGLADLLNRFASLRSIP